MPLTGTDKASVISELVRHLCDVYSLDSFGEILDGVLEREEMMSTGVGHGLAIPHAKIDGISSPKIVGGISPAGIEFEAIDERPARIFFLVVSPKCESCEHVKILSELSRIMNNPDVRDKVTSAEDGTAVIEVLRNHER